jgi:DNA-binding response OmpR family regulator
MNLIEHEYTRLLVVDDDLLLQAVLGQFLCLQGFHVTPAEHGEAAKTILLEQRIQLVILDIIMPDKDGLYWLQWIKENCPSLPVLILSSQSSDQDRIKGLELGADDYLTKPFHPKELLIRVSNLLRTHPNANPSASNKTFQIGIAILNDL